MTDEQKKEWYTSLYGCYFERLNDQQEIEVLDPTTIRKVEKVRQKIDLSKVIIKPPIMIQENKSKP